VKIFLVWDGYEDVIGVFGARHLAETYLNDYMQAHNANSIFKRARNHYSIIAYMLNQPDINAE